MATVRVTPLGSGRTEVVHEASGTSLTTASSPEWGGVGGSFSATDLVAAALGSCIGSSIAGPLERRGVDLDAVTIEVTKSLAEEPRRIDRHRRRARPGRRAGSDDVRRRPVTRRDRDGRGRHRRVSLPSQGPSPTPFLSGCASGWMGEPDKNEFGG